MVNTIVKLALSAGIVWAVSEIAKRNSFAGGLLASLPLTSLLAFLWLYYDTHDAAKVAALSSSIFWLVLPSLVLFLLLPLMLRRHIPFYGALILSLVGMFMCYGAMIFVAKKAGIKL